MTKYNPYPKIGMSAITDYYPGVINWDRVKEHLSKAEDNYTNGEYTLSFQFDDERTIVLVLRRGNLPESIEEPDTIIATWDLHVPNRN